MPYVDAQDIRQHMPRGGSIAVPSIIELMDEEEAYVKLYLDMDPLPENKPVLRSIIRDLTTSKVISELTSPTADDLAKADYLRKNAMERLEIVNKDGLEPSNLSTRDASKELYNPYPTPFFSMTDFWK